MNGIRIGDRCFSVGDRVLWNPEEQSTPWDRGVVQFHKDHYGDEVLEVVAVRNTDGLLMLKAVQVLTVRTQKGNVSFLSSDFKPANTV